MQYDNYDPYSNYDIYTNKETSDSVETPQNFNNITPNALEKMSIRKILMKSLIDLKKSWWKLMLASIVIAIKIILAAVLVTILSGLIGSFANSVYRTTRSIGTYRSLYVIGEVILSLFFVGVGYGILYNAYAVALYIKRTGKPSKESFNVFGGIGVGIGFNFHIFFKVLIPVIILAIVSYVSLIYAIRSYLAPANTAKQVVSAILSLLSIGLLIYILIKLIYEYIACALYFPLKYDNKYKISWQLYDKSKLLMEQNHAFFTILLIIVCGGIYGSIMLVLKLLKLLSIAKILIGLIGFILVSIIFSYGLLVLVNFYEMFNPAEAWDRDNYIKPATDNKKYLIILAVLVILSFIFPLGTFPKFIAGIKKFI